LPPRGGPGGTRASDPSDPGLRLWTNGLNRRSSVRPAVGLAELFVAVVIVGVSCVNAAAPAAAWWRARDGRFLFLSAANLGIAALGLVWVWGQFPWSPPSWTNVELPVAGLVLLVTLLLLATTLWPRRS